ASTTTSDYGGPLPSAPGDGADLAQGTGGCPAGSHVSAKILPAADRSPPAPTGYSSVASDEAHADGVGHRVRPVLQVEARGDVVDHALDRALRVRELAGDLRRLHPLRRQAQDLDLSPAERIGPGGAALAPPPRVELVEEAAHEVGW